MDTSKERIDALKKCKKLQEYGFSKRKWKSDYEVWLPRIDQHLEILKSTMGGFSVDIEIDNKKNICNIILYHDLVTGDDVLVYQEESLTIERGLDNACEFVLEWALNQKESK